MRKKRKTTSSAKMTEFSKRVVLTIVPFWMLIGVYAAVVVWHNPSNLCYLLDYVGAPVVGTIVGYLAKAAFENHRKIKNAVEVQPEPSAGRYSE